MFLRRIKINIAYFVVSFHNFDDQDKIEVLE